MGNNLLVKPRCEGLVQLCLERLTEEPLFLEDPVSVALQVAQVLF